MKKLFVTIVFLVGFCLSALAQQVQEVVYLKDGSVIKGTIIEQVPNVSLKIQTSDGSIFAYKMSEVTKITKVAVEKRNTRMNGRSGGCAFKNDKALGYGYKGFVDFGYTLGTGDFGIDRVEFMTSHGMQFNPYIFAGVGAGVHYYPDAEGVVVPVFANVRGTFLNGNITPFIDMKVGYGFVDAEGFYMSPTVGCRIGLGARWGLNIGIGYSIQKAALDYYDGYDYYSGHLSVGGFSMKVGIDF